MKMDLSPSLFERSLIVMLEPKEGYCTHCEQLSYFILLEEGYECQYCKAINTMRGLKDIEDPSLKAETTADIVDTDDIV